MKYRYIEIEPHGRGSFYLLADGQYVARFNDVRQAEQVRQQLIEEQCSDETC